MKKLIIVACLLASGYSSATTVEDLSLDKPAMVMPVEVMPSLKGMYAMLNTCKQNVEIGQPELDLIEKVMVDNRVDWVDMSGNPIKHTETNVKHMRTLYDNDLMYAWNEMKDNSARRLVYRQNCQTAVRVFHSSDFYRVFSAVLGDNNG